MAEESAEGRWARGLEGEAGLRVAKTILNLGLRDLGRYPSPRTGRFPFGPEARILSGFVKGEPVQLYASGLWRLYQRLASARLRQAYQAFTLGAALERAEWTRLLGEAETTFWQERGLLLAAERGLRAAFRIVVLGDICLLADAFAHQTRFALRVHIGRDTLELFEFLRSRKLSPKRHLDVGTGSGALLLSAAVRAEERIGVDINPRAIAVARFNAVLNGVSSSLLDADIFSSNSLGSFDLVTWNLPFQFFPEAERAVNLDGDGGAFGIELTLRFIDRLPELLTDGGRAVLMTSSPLLTDGTQLLVQALRERQKLGLDTKIRDLGALWAPARRDFYRTHRVRRIDNVILEISRGSGQIEHARAPALQRAVDRLQETRYHRHGSA